MSNLGGFSEEAFEICQRLLSEQGNVGFSEGETYDFTRCVRPNGTAYGTKGKCRKGTEEEKQEVAPKTKKSAKVSKSVNSSLKAVKQKVASKVSESDPEKVYAALVKKQQELVEQGDIAGATKLNSKIKAAFKKVKASPKTKAASTGEDPSKALATLEKQQSKLLKDFTKKRGKYDSMTEGPEKEKLGGEIEKMAKTYMSNKEKITALKNKGARSTELDTDDLSGRDEERNRRGKAYREGQWNTNLSEKQRAAIRDYTDEGGQRPYSDLNGCLRQPRTCDPENKGWTGKHAKELDSALKALPKNDDSQPFWRGARADSGQALALYQALENAKPGVKMKDPAFGSYSYDEAVAKSFTSRSHKSILFVSRSKQLTPIDTFSEISIEREALLPRGTEQTIRSIRKEGQMLIVEID
jgi:hypothetical protein